MFRLASKFHITSIPRAKPQFTLLFLSHKYVLMFDINVWVTTTIIFIFDFGQQNITTNKCHHVVLNQ